jgi:transcriptional regulator with XRE-family HTH domain
MEIPTKIDQIMKERGVTDSDLADLTELTRMTIGNARRGKSVTLRVAQKISKALKEPIETLWPTPQEEEEAA